MKLIAIFALFAVAFSQDLDESVSSTLQWPQNDDTRAGAIVHFAYSDVADGSCIVQFPDMVYMFHAMNAHIVTGDVSNPVEGRYKIAAPADWEAVNGTFNVLIVFDIDAIFNITDIEFTCDPGDVADLTVYSFPQNTLVKEASSNVFYRPGFHKGDVLTITLPQPVARFNFTTMDSEFKVESDGSTSYTLSGFKNEVGVDDQKEVHFSIDYMQSDDGSTWFSAASVTVAVQNIPEEDESAPI